MSASSFVYIFDYVMMTHLIASAVSFLFLLLTSACYQLCLIVLV